MTRFRVEVAVEKGGLAAATVEMLTRKIARVVEGDLGGKVSAGDIVRLNRDPRDDFRHDYMEVVKFLFRKNPSHTYIDFHTLDQRNLLLALVAVLQVEVVEITDIDTQNGPTIGTILVAHPRHIDMRSIADGAGVTTVPGMTLDDQLEEPPAFDTSLTSRFSTPTVMDEDGVSDPLSGLCRDPSLLGFADPQGERSIAVFSPEGECVFVRIDTRVRCERPQFRIDGRPFYFPITSFEVPHAPADPEPGSANGRPDVAQGPTVAQTGSTEDKVSEDPEAKQAEEPERPAE